MKQADILEYQWPHRLQSILTGKVLTAYSNSLLVCLIPHQFMVETDHKALEFLHSSLHLNTRLTKWALKLQQYNFCICYRPGKHNQNADALSRQAWTYDEDEAKNKQERQDPPRDVRTSEDGSQLVPYQPQTFISFKFSLACTYISIHPHTNLVKYCITS